MLKLKLNNKRDFNYNRNIILCTSFLSIPFTLNLIKKFKDISVIITQSKEIFEFFKKFYPNLDIIFIEQLKSLINKNPLIIIKNNYYNYLLKKKINFFFTKYSNSSVFTNIRAFSPLSAYILIVLSKKNKIYHQKLVKVSWKKIQSNLKFKILKFYNKIMFGLDCHTILTKQNKKILVYSNKFYKKINAKNINYKINANLIKEFAKKNFSFTDNKILLLCSGFSLERKLIDKKLFFEFMKQLSLSNNFEKLLLKKKNFSEKKKYLEKKLNEVPAYIPANLLIYNFKVIIGYNSATLFEAANKSCKAISLLYLLSKDVEIVNHYVDYFNRNLKKNKKIFYPKTFQEFINYCNLAINK